MAAANLPAAIYTSTNSGLTWTPTDAPVVSGWICGASSADGTKLVVVGEEIYTSTNAGLTWTQTSAPTNQYWFSIASSSDATKLVVSTGGSIYGSGIWTSTNSGLTWIQTSAPTNGDYSYSVASSADGSKLVAVDTFVETINISTNSGFSWTQSSAPAKAWRCVASSSDGTKLVAGTQGSSDGIFTSTNSGFTWALSPDSATLEKGWFCVASSSDGNKLVAIASSGLLVNGKSVLPIYGSTNSGVSWVKTSAPATGYWSIASSSDGTKLVAVSAYGEIYTATAIRPPSLTLQFFSGYPLLSLYGNLGDTYTVQYTTNLATTNWAPMLIVPHLSISPFQMIDPTGVGQPMRFYRAIQQ